jgi:hypothetical protein
MSPGPPKTVLLRCSLHFRVHLQFRNCIYMMNIERNIRKKFVSLQSNQQYDSCEFVSAINEWPVTLDGCSTNIQIWVAENKYYYYIIPFYRRIMIHQLKMSWLKQLCKLSVVGPLLCTFFKPWNLKRSQMSIVYQWRAWVCVWDLVIRGSLLHQVSLFLMKFLQHTEVLHMYQGEGGFSIFMYIYILYVGFSDTLLALENNTCAIWGSYRGADDDWS